MAQGRVMLDIAGDNEEIRGVLNSILLERSPTRTLRDSEANRGSFNDRLWNELTSGGWLELSSPGADGDPVAVDDLQLALIELGRAGAAVPYRSVVAVLGLMLSLKHRDSSAAAAQREAIGRGEVWVPAVTESSWLALPMSTTVAGDRLTGVKEFVSDATDTIDGLVVAAQVDATSIGWYAVPRNASGLVIEWTANSALESQARVSLTEVEARLLVTAPAQESLNAWHTLKRFADASWMIGLCWRVLEMTAQHAADREQFNRAIGSFQAVQHKLADMAIGTQMCADLGRQAAVSLRDLGPDHDQSRALAAEAMDAARRVGTMVAENAHQIWGGSGVSVEYDLQLFTRRLKSTAYTGDDPDDARDEILALRYPTAVN